MASENHSATLTSAEKAHALIGAFQRYNFEQFGDDLPRVYERIKTLDTLPGEIVCSAADDPVVKKLTNIANFKKTVA